MINIKEKLDDYLEFDSSKLFIDESVRIFGGAIRDIIAEQEINDIDILLGVNPKRVIGAGEHNIQFNRYSEIEKVLLEEGYIHHSSLGGREITSMYNMLLVIHEPKTWIKGKKIIQLIRPNFFRDRIKNDARWFDFTHLLSTDHKLHTEVHNPPRKLSSVEVIHFMNNFAAQVDLSCCGVSYDGKSLYENIQYAVLHCQNKYFMLNTDGLMFNEARIIYRESKLWKRGWKKINSTDTQLIRDFKISSLFSDTQLEFIKQW